MNPKNTIPIYKDPCKKCGKRDLKRNEALTCSMCKNLICLICSNISDKLYCLKTKESKEKWKCIKCLSQGATTSSTPSPLREEYVTIRRKNPVMSPTESTSSCQSFSDYDTTSLPDLSTYHCATEIEDLRQQVLELKIQLQSANDEVERLTLENDQLMSKTRGNEFRINTLKKICNENIKTAKKQGKSARRQKIKQKKIDFTLDTEEFHMSQIPSEIDDNHSETIVDQTNPETNSLLGNFSRKPLCQETSPKEKPRKIIFFGSQQCRGLAKATSIRVNRAHNLLYEKYRVSSFLKPNAQSEDVVSTMRSHNFEEQDTVILCLGENDSNPTKVKSALNYAQKLCKNCHLLVLSVNNSTHLNKSVLNNTLKAFCNSSKKSKFIETLSNNHDRKSYLIQTAKAINFDIDCRDYDERFIKNIKIEIQKRRTPTMKYDTIRNNLTINNIDKATMTTPFQNILNKNIFFRLSSTM